MKYIFLVFIVMVSCNYKSNISVRVKEYSPAANNRGAMELGTYLMNKENLVFASSLSFDTVLAYKRSYNFYQSLYNKWQRKEIDSVNYVYKLSNLKQEDSINLAKGYKISGLKAYPDTKLNAEIKMLIGINKMNKKILIIIDENNNNLFNDDKLIIIDTNNYKNIFDTLHFIVSNLKAYLNDSIIDFQIPIMINQLSYSDKPKVFDELFDLNPWISSSQYYRGKKRIAGKKIYFDFGNLIYEYNNNSYSTVTSLTPITRGGHNNVYYEGDYLKINYQLYHIDSFGKKKVLLSIVKKIPKVDKLDLYVPILKLN